MLEELPFYSISNSVLDDELQINAARFKKTFNENFSDLGIREFMFNLCKDSHFKSLQSSYFSCDQFNQRFVKCRNNIELSIFHLNIRSLNSKQREFCTLTNLLEVDFDILILSEIWKNNIDFYQNILDGYDLHTDLPVDSCVGGIGIFVKKALPCKLRPDMRLQSSNLHKTENLWLEISKNKTKYIVGGIYRHPNQNIQEFSDLIEPTLNKISKGKLPCFIAGDINIDFLKVEINKNTENCLNNLLVHNFFPALLLPTRITSNSAAVIDHIYYYQGTNSKKSIN